MHCGRLSFGFTSDWFLLLDGGLQVVAHFRNFRLLVTFVHTAFWYLGLAWLRARFYSFRHFWSFVLGDALISVHTHFWFVLFGRLWSLVGFVGWSGFILLLSAFSMAGPDQTGFLAFRPAQRKPAFGF